MVKSHAKLRGAMIVSGIDERYLARKLSRSLAYISTRMMGRKPWPLDEAYAIMDMLQIPHEQLPVYFPPKGRAM